MVVRDYRSPKRKPCYQPPLNHRINLVTALLQAASLGQTWTAHPCARSSKVDLSRVEQTDYRTEVQRRFKRFLKQSFVTHS
jgi:hypothetical protein